MSSTTDEPGSAELTRVTANLTMNALDALDRVATTSGRNRTDLINVAVLLLAELYGPLRARKVLLETPDGQERLRVLF